MQYGVVFVEVEHCTMLLFKNKEMKFKEQRYLNGSFIFDVFKSNYRKFRWLHKQNNSRIYSLIVIPIAFFIIIAEVL